MSRKKQILFDRVNANHFHFLVKIKEDIRYKYTMEEVVKANARNVVRSKDADKLGWVKDFAINKWATFPLPDGVNDPSALKGNDAPSALKGSGDEALKGNDVEAGENDGPPTFRGGMISMPQRCLVQVRRQVS